MFPISVSLACLARPVESRDKSHCQVARLGTLKPEDRDFGTHIEADLKEMSHAATDVHAAAPRQCDLAGSIPLVPYRQFWWRQERWLALASVRVAGKDPALILAPDRKIYDVRIVAEHDGGGILAVLRKHRCWIKTRAPKVVKSN